MKQKIILLVLLGILLVANLFGAVAFADEGKSTEETIYTDILEDLQKDTTFNASDYPKKANDYSLELFQVAESIDKELFVYLYQPSEDKVTATEIRLSQSIEENFSAKDYPLKLLSRNGTLAKYLVENLTVLDDVVRYYEIVQVVRPFDSALGDSIDHVSGATQTASTVPYAVGKRFTATTSNGEVTYTEIHAETITVTSKFVGFVRYMGGYVLHKGACDAHFVAFDTDRPMDKLLAAKVSFVTQKSEWIRAPFGQSTENYLDKVSNVVNLSYKDEANYTGGGLFGTTYSWKRIERVSDFMQETVASESVFWGAKYDVSMGELLTDEAKESLSKNKWILRFYETNYEYHDWVQSGTSTRTSTIIEDVTILELTFETNGNTYHLGVVDNKQSGSRDPIATVDPIQDQIDLLKKMSVDFYTLLLEIALFIVVAIVVVGVIKYLARG